MSSSSIASTSSTLPPVKTSKPVARTYGRKKDAPDSTTTDDAPVFSRRAALAALAASNLLLTSEPDDLPLRADSHAIESTSDGDVEMPSADEADEERGRVLTQSLSRRAHRASSSSERHSSNLTTDPTTEEDLAEAANPRKSSAEGRVASLVSSSDVESDEDRDDADDAAIFGRKSVAEMMEEQRLREEEEDRLEEEALKAGKSPSSILPPAATTSRPPLHESSSLTTLPTSDAPPSAQQPPNSDVVTSPSLLAAIAAQLPPRAAAHPLFNPSSPSRSQNNASDEDDEPSKPRTKPRRVIADSDEENSEDDAPVFQRRVKKPVAAMAGSDSDADGESSDKESSESTPRKELTKAERLEQLVKKRAPAPVPVKEKEVITEADLDSGIDDSSDEDGTKKGKGKGKKKEKKVKGALSKKDEEAMNRESAALQRDQHAGLQARTKKSISINSVLAIASKKSELAIPVAPHKPSSMRTLSTVADNLKFRPSSAPTVVNLAQSSSSQSAIEEADDTPPRPSEKVLGKQVERRRVVIPSSASNITQATKEAERESDEDDLMDLDSELKRRKEQQQKALEAEKKAADAKAFAARKKAAAEASRRAMVEFSDSESGSDLEIVGAPGAVRKPSRFANVPPTPKERGIKFENEAKDTPRMTERERQLAKFVGDKAVHHSHDDDHVTESQIKAAGKAFGNNLSTAHAELLGTKKSKSKPAVKPTSITHDQLAEVLRQRTAEQNHAARVKKETLARRKAQEKATAARKEDLQAVDVDGILAKKAEKMKEAAEQGEQLEDEDDEDYVAGEDVGDSDEEGYVDGSAEEAGSGSGEEYDETGSGSEQEQEQEQEEERAASVSSFSIPATESAGHNEDNAAGDDEELMPPPAAGRRRIRIEDDEDQESSLPAKSKASVSLSSDSNLSSDAPAPASAGVFGDGGFSQLFADDDGDEGFGFDGGNMPQATFFAPQMVNADELQEDVEMAEAEGAVDHTPRAAPIVARRYINKDGQFTQTRPANRFAISPSIDGTPNYGSSVTRDTQTQISQTQIEPATPTQAPRDPRPLGRNNALVPLGTAFAGTPTQLAATEVVPSAHATSESGVEATPQNGLEEPQSGQPFLVRNAFDVLAKGAVAAAAPPPAPAAPKTRNAFIDTEADLSDDEMMGLGGAGSADEDEAGLDAELESLVDHEEVNEELAAEQDFLARQLHDEELAKQDAKDEAQAKRIAEGKERMKRKNGGLDLSDDDYDDDNYGMSKRKKKNRVQNTTMEQLEANEDTQAFAKPLKDGLVVPVKEGEYDFLVTVTPDSDESEDDGDDEGNRSQDDEHDQLPSRHAKKERMSVQEAVRLAAERSRERAQGREVSREPTPDFFNSSSSPQKKITIKKRTASVVLQTANQDVDFESQYSYTKKYESAGAWKLDSKEDSQGTSNGQTAGGRSAVTSFKKEQKVRATYGGSIGGGKNGTMTVTAKSKMSFRKNGFAS
ncbi:hypothetical protein MNV49_000286 [Pseudohyphozyma bogoriensis]|nr:hypothetical protein MNV49_000286 [Pseudohyphozyma bogoriensis]